MSICSYWNRSQASKFHYNNPYQILIESIQMSFVPVWLLDVNTQKQGLYVGQHFYYEHTQLHQRSTTQTP